MSRRNQYYLIDFFNDEFRKLVAQRRSFEYIRTSYTKKLKTNSQTIIFNNDGIGDDMILTLINKVRNDAKRFIERNPHVIHNSERIHFLDMFELPNDDEIIVKVDLTSAYWRLSLLEGIVSNETNDFFETTFADRTGREKKQARLRALGALATRKEIETFENGKSISWEIEEQQTKQLYMHICRRIDNVMQECRFKCDGCIFYYWDCMFVRKQYENDVIKFFQSKQFECKSEETRLSYDTIGTRGFFTSECDGKMYMVAQENESLLHKLNKI